MKMRRILALILCIALLLVVISGCRNTDDVIDDPDENGSDVSDPNGDADTSVVSGIDFEAALTTFPPDTVMIRSGDLALTWADLYVFLYRAVLNIVEAQGEDIDWSEEPVEGMTLAELALEYSTEEALSFLAYMYGIKANNLTLSGQDLAAFNDDINSIVEMYRSAEEFEKSLREEGGFYNFDVFENLLKVEYTIGHFIDSLYGDEGAGFPDERVAEFAEQSGYMHAMHILILKPSEEEDEEDTSLEISEAILELLNEYFDTDEFMNIFTELMFEYSEDDGGLMEFPDGFLFREGEMPTEFYNAVSELEVGELSGLVEEDYGFHIIIRLPIDYDAVPMSMYDEGNSRTLRQVAAMEDFDLVRSEWFAGLDPEKTPEYLSLDIATIFKWH